MRDLTDYTENYLEHSFESIQVAYRKLKVIELINNQKHNNILEVGCGLDPLFNSLSDFDKLVIVEPSTIFCDNVIKIVNKDFTLSKKVIVINNYMENSINELLNYEFDYILISCLLHELENYSSIFDKLRYLVKKDTVVHIDVPNAFSFHRLLAKEMGIIDSIFDLSDANLRLQQQRVFNLSSLSNLIVSQGYKILDSGSYFIKPFTHKQMYEMVSNKIIDSQILDGFYKMSKYLPDFGSEIFVDFKLND